MTESRCIPIEELGRLRSLPEGAPERAHAESCPRCRAALLALAEFEREGDVLPPEAGAEQARARLDATIDSLTGAEPVASPAAARPAPRGDDRGWLARLFAPPAARWAAGLTVVALVAATAWLAARGPAGGTAREPGVVRGDAPERPALAVHSTDGGWEIAWQAVPDAETYDIVFLDVELHAVARITGLREPRLVLDRSTLPPGVAPGVTLLLEVDARAGRDLLQASVPSAIRLD